jgi:hypothetical protein
MNTLIRAQCSTGHSAGRIATSQLVDLIGITSDSAVLDAGSGIACAADIG